MLEKLELGPRSVAPRRVREGLGLLHLGPELVDAALVLLLGGRIERRTGVAEVDRLAFARELEDVDGAARRRDDPRQDVDRARVP